MNNISDLSKLSFFTVTKYNQADGQVCDFTGIPRPHYCMGLILDGKGDFKFGDEMVTVEKGDIIFVPIGSTYASHWSGAEGHFISVCIFLLKLMSFSHVIKKLRYKG